MNKKIIFNAPIGKGTPLERIGGAEAGCLKTMAIYKEAGIDVIHLDRPASKGGMIRYIIGMSLLPIKLVILLLIYPSAVVHIVGFYHRTIGLEKALVQIGRILGHKVIYEPRNGSMVISYQEGDSSYRKKMDYLLSKPDVVLCQVMEYMNMIKETYGIERSYYPNYIMDEFVKSNTLNRGDQIRLLYFGRIVPEKNVDVAIKVCSILRKRGYNVKIDIIGGYNEAYKHLLDEIIKAEEVDEFVIFHGRKPFPYIANILYQSHYYLFPSAEANEGHSNSLTEAMGCGVVPIVSKAGSNASICGNPDLVVDDLLPESYSEVIDKIQRNKKWEMYSEFCYKRVKANYTQSIVKDKLLKYIMPLFE